MSHRERKRKREFYYREAIREGYRSRASYKLKQINEKFNVFKHGNIVLDVGAAPGGWSQIASELVKPGLVYAIDLDYIEPMENVIAIRGDITKKETHEKLKTLISKPVDVIIADLSPKVSGNWSTDHARQIYLTEQALRLCVSGILKRGGKFVCKLFMGDLYENFVSNLKKLFTVVYFYKPKASRKQSAETYAIAKGLKKGPIKWRKKSLPLKVRKMIDFPLKTVIEGNTSIIVPDVDAIKETPSNFPPADAPVFYNKVMEMNRDFALAALRAYIKLYNPTKALLYCEPMAGSGIRSVRVANEIDNLKAVINDRNSIAVELIKKNVKHLKLKKKTEISTDDANSLMLKYASQGELFDTIDIDPFGSPATFIDATVQAIKKDGLIAITSTDMATMCGVYQKACIRKYASKPIHSSIAHEISIRMLVGYLVFALARHEKATIPLFAHSTAHYIRVYALAKKGITKAKETMQQLGYIAHCQNCFTIDHSFGIINQLSNKCPACQSKWLIGGPYWLGQLYDENFVSGLDSELSRDNAPYNTLKKMRKILSLVKEEVKTNTTPKAMIGFFDLHQIADKLNIPSPKLDATIQEIQNKGFIATRTHFRVNSIKTDASVENVIVAMKKVLGI